LPDAWHLFEVSSKNESKDERLERDQNEYGGKEPAAPQVDVAGYKEPVRPGKGRGDDDLHNAREHQDGGLRVLRYGGRDSLAGRRSLHGANTCCAAQRLDAGTGPTADLRPSWLFTATSANVRSSKKKTDFPGFNLE
jgi:hypothetical protein